jgi:hypothetical protein
MTRLVRSPAPVGEFRWCQRSLRSSVRGPAAADASPTKALILTQVRPRPSDSQAHGRQIIFMSAANYGKRHTH